MDVMQPDGKIASDCTWVSVPSLTQSGDETPKRFIARLIAQRPCAELPAVVRQNVIAAFAQP